MRYPLVDGQGNFGSIDGDPAGGDALHRSASGFLRRGAARRHRHGHGRFSTELRRLRGRARVSAGGGAASAGQRLERHCGRHGDKYSAAQPERGHRRDHPAYPPSQDQIRTHYRDRARTGFSDRRHSLRPRRGVVGLQDRPRPYRSPRQNRYRADRQRPLRDHRRRNPVPGEQGAPDQEGRRPGQSEEDRGDQRHPRRKRPPRHAHRFRVEARRGTRGRAQQPLQADRLAAGFGHHHAGDRRRPSARARSARLPQAVYRPPPGHRAAAHQLPAAQGAQTASTFCWDSRKRCSGSTT